VAAVRRVHEASRGALVVQATGLGKTVLFCEIGRLMGGCLVLVHRDSLARQAAQKLETATGQQVGVEKAERTAWMGTRYVVASVQTLKGPRLARFAERFKFPVIITDEAHRSVAAGTGRSTRRSRARSCWG
jgi:superfamily II DNA or RNA helicase